MVAIIRGFIVWCISGYSVCRFLCVKGKELVFMTRLELGFKEKDTVLQLALFYKGRLGNVG